MRNFRNDMYLVSEALRIMQKSKVKEISATDEAVLANYKKHIDYATKFIPTWVKVAVALALGLGTMIGWKRIVITVGEKIGKDHLTYGQGAAAEITAMLTIGAADMYGLAGEHDARAVVGRGRNHGGERDRPAVGNGAKPGHGLGADAAGSDRPVGNAVLGVREDLTGLCEVACSSLK